ELGGDEHALEAARLAKADQASELVREFPELEGHIGSTYATLAGQPDEVARAIDEQYLPDSAGAPIPVTPAGRVLAAADKLAHLARALHESEATDEFASVYEAFDRAHRLAGKRSDAAAAVDESAFEHDTERELYSALRERTLEPNDFDNALRSAAEISPLVS